MDDDVTYDTSTVPPAERFAFWRDAVCESYVQLGCDAECRTDFSGKIEIARHSLLSISHVGGKAHHVERRSRDISRATEAYFLLSVQLADRSRISQFGSTATLQPGDMALYTSADPYRLDLCDDFGQLVVQLPADQLLARLPHAEALAAKRIDGRSEIGKLVGDNLKAFAVHAGHDDPVVQSMVQTTLIDLIATGLASIDGQGVSLSSPDRQILLRAKSFIHDNLGDPDLDRTMVALHVGMSVRRLNAIFSGEDGSIAGSIRSARLETTKADLTDPRFQAMSISEVALKNGFSNLQHFSTMFKAWAGQSPRDYRAGDMTTSSGFEGLRRKSSSI